MCVADMFTAKQKDELGSAGKTYKCVSHLPVAGKEEHDRRPRIVLSDGGIASGAAVAELWRQLSLRSAKRFPVGLRAGRSGPSIARGLKPIAIDDKPGRFSQRLFDTYRANRAERSSGSGASAPNPCRLALHGSYDGRARSLRCNGRPSRSPVWLNQRFHRPTEDMRYLTTILSQSSFVQTPALPEERSELHSCVQGAAASRQRLQGQTWTGAHTRYVSIRELTAPRPSTCQFLAMGRRSSSRSKRHHRGRSSNATASTMLVQLPMRTDECGCPRSLAHPQVSRAARPP